MRDPDAIRLLNWKKPTDRDVWIVRVRRVDIDLTMQKTSGDFTAVLYEVVSKRSSVIEGSLSVDDLNEILDDLARNMGKQ